MAVNIQGNGGPNVIYSEWEAPLVRPEGDVERGNENDPRWCGTFRDVAVGALSAAFLAVFVLILYFAGWKRWLEARVDRWMSRCTSDDNGVSCPEMELARDDLIISGLSVAICILAGVIGAAMKRRMSTTNQSSPAHGTQIHGAIIIAFGPIATIIGIGIGLMSAAGTAGILVVGLLCGLIGILAILEACVLSKHMRSATLIPHLTHGAVTRLTVLVDTSMIALLISDQAKQDVLISKVLGLELKWVSLIAICVIWTWIWSASLYLLFCSNPLPDIAEMHGCSALSRATASPTLRKNFESTTKNLLFLTTLVLAPVRGGLLLGVYANPSASRAYLIIVWASVVASSLKLTSDSYSTAEKLFRSRRERGVRGYRILANGEEEEYPKEMAGEDQSSLFSRFTFWWVTPVLTSANRKGRLEERDLPILPEYDQPKRLYQRLSSLIEERRAKGKPPLSGTSMFATLMFRMQPITFLLSLVCGWLFLACMFVDPIILRHLLASSESGGGKLREHLALILALSVSMWIRVGCMELCYFASTRTMANCRSALVQSVYHAAIHLPPKVEAKGGYDTGKVTNLVATDADEFAKAEWVVFFLAQWTWAVVSLPACLYFVYELVGSAAFIGVSMILIGTGMNFFIYSNLKPVYKRVQTSRDVRSRVMNGLIKTIKAVKLQMCELLWKGRVEEARAVELRNIKIAQYWSAFNQLTGNLASLAVPVSIFTWYTVYEKKTLDPTTAFTVLAWINQMQWSINTLPGMFNLYAFLTPSCTRLSNFLHESSEWSTDKRPSSDTKDKDSLNPVRVVLSPPVPTLRHENSVGSGGTLENGGDGSMLEDSKHLNDYKLDRKISNEVIISVSDAEMGYCVVQEVHDDKNDEIGDDSHRESDQTLETKGEQKVKKEIEDMNRVVENRVVLGDINLSITMGELVIIAGGVGSGKSTLLKTLAKAMPPLSGQLSTFGMRAYVGQKPCMLNATIKQNILFGLPCHDHRYKWSLNAAVLEPDLKALKEGDLTSVGESGVQMSGGQKARIALARALYSNADVYFFDDVLSAVDAHTGRLIWDRCFRHLSRVGKTVVLATHQLQYINRPLVRRVLVLENKTISLNGPWKDILARAGQSLVAYVSEAPEERKEQEEGEGSDEKKRGEEGTEKKKKSNNEGEEESDIDLNSVQVSLGECISLLRRKMRRFEGRTLDTRCMDQITEQLSGKAENAEGRAHGLIAWSDFKVYLGAFGSKFTVSVLVIAAIAGAGLGVAGNIWLSIWSERNQGGMRAIIDLIIYTSIGAANSALTALTTILLTINSLVASRILHGLMLSGILAADMAFFDVTPSGRILNRFLQDLQSIDTFVPSALLGQLTKTLNLVSRLSLVLIYAPFSIVSLVIIAPVYYNIFMRVRIAARDARRLAAAAHSPCYAHFSDSMSGRETVRAFGAEARFEKRSLRLVQDMARKKYANNSVLKWNQALTTQVGCILYLACGVTCVFLIDDGRMTTAEMGLVLLYAAQLQRSMMDYLCGLTSVETNFVSVERIAEYTRLAYTDGDAAVAESKEQKSDPKSSRPKVSVDWLRASTDVRDSNVVHDRNIASRVSETKAEGGVRIVDVHMRYRLHKPYVLNGISLDIPAGAKVALCGRTGCGKSTLFSVLARLYPISRGNILIDGQDIQDMSLNELRSNVQVVDQDAVLIEAPLRRNLLGSVGEQVLAAEAARRKLSERKENFTLFGRAGDEKSSFDPGGFYSDAAMWRALEASGLASKVRELPGRLDFKVKDGGSNFSSGERQLIALTRALLSAHRTKVLLCDEATAHVDLHTDDKIHDTLLKMGLTVIMICHRLQHIHRFDYVAVLDAGTVGEFGPPLTLLKTKGSYLRSLFEHANIAVPQL
ncbi:hypothetical protein AAMO2058_000466100 [Amorphochlora amoebiformis]